MPSRDGTPVGYHDEGEGKLIVIVHGGSSHAANWDRVVSHLRGYRVVRIERSVYENTRPLARHAMAREVEDILAVLDAVGPHALLVGHSSGAIAALETAREVQRAGLYLDGLVAYEPPIGLGAPLGGDALVRAEAALADGDRGGAMLIFLEEIAQMGGPMLALMKRMPGAWKEMSAHAPGQIADTRAIEHLRVDRYHRLDVPTTLIGGGMSPPHLRERLEALARVIPRAHIEIIPRAGHVATMSAPKRLAEIIAAARQ